MEMRTHHPSKRGSMEVAVHGEDRLSSLPDDLLHSIIRELPLKHAARTSALSRQWAPRWLRALASSRVLDLTDSDFARGQPPARAAATVRRCLDLHAEQGEPLDVFRVALMSPPPAGSSDGGAFGRDVVGWIASAVARGAREVEVDLLTPAKGDDDADDGGSAAFVELPGDLLVARNSLARLALAFAFHSDLFNVDDYDDDLVSSIDLGSTPALRDAYLSQIGFGHAYEYYYAYGDLLSCVAHAPVWTLCSVGLLFPGHARDNESGAGAAALAGEVVDDSEMRILGKDFVLDQLSFIKLVNFCGNRFELQLLAFLLKRAPALEQLVLITVGEDGIAPGDEHVIRGWVSETRKASPEVQLTVCRSSEDHSQNPVHTRFYHELEE